jgi:hypothetical protein
MEEAGRGSAALRTLHSAATFSRRGASRVAAPVLNVETEYA